MSEHIGRVMTPDRWMTKAAELFPYEVQDDGTQTAKVWRAIFDTKRFEIAAALRAVESATWDDAMEHAARKCEIDDYCDYKPRMLAALLRAMKLSLKSAPPPADEEP